METSSNLPLPLPPSSLIHSVLPNGFNYYIHHNPYPKNRILVHLIVSVGSLCEKNNERGIAHFLEHLAFRGTKTFDHGELIKFFERAGMGFGHHVNAHTGQSETIYKLDVPADEDLLLLGSALDVVAEWACGGIRISPKDVEAERNIIEEEWRGCQGSGQRMLATYWSRLFNDGGSTLYAERMPIGMLEVIRTVQPNVLRSFYKKWYRSDTMAVVVVGDFQPNSEKTTAKIVQQITDRFSGLPVTENALMPPVAPNPKHQQGLAIALMDTELTATALNVEFFQPIVTDNNMSMIKNVMCKKLFTSILDRRLRILSKSTLTKSSTSKELPVLLTGSVGVNPVVPTLERTTMSIWTRQGDEEKGLECLLMELIHLVRTGFTKQEFSLACEKWRNSIHQQINDATSCSSSSIANELKYHYLQGHAYIGFGLENSISLSTLNAITKEELLIWIQARYNIEQLYQENLKKPTPSDHFFAVSSQIQRHTDGFESHEALAKTFSKTMQRVLENLKQQNSNNETKTDNNTNANIAKNDNNNPQETVSRLSIARPKHHHRVIQKTTMQSIDAKEWKLSNGITVCIKEMATLGKEGLQFQGFALRGRTELNEREDTNFCFLPDLVAESGLSNLNGLEMSDMKSRTSCRVNVQKHMYHRGIGGSCKSNADVELLLQQIYMIMTHVQLDTNALDVLVARTKESVQNQNNSPESCFMRKVQKLLFGDDVPLLRPLTIELLEQVTVQQMQRLFHTAYVEKPSNYVMVFAGKIPNNFQYLIEKYIGGLEDEKMEDVPELPVVKTETNKKVEDSFYKRWSLTPEATPSTMGITLPTSVVEHLAEERVALKSTSMLCLPVPLLGRDTVVLDHALNIACILLKNILLSEVRQKQSDVYNISVAWNHTNMARHGAIVISWSNKPGNTERIKRAVLHEIKQLQMNGPLQESLNSVVAIDSLRIQSTENDISYWLFHLLDGYKTQRFVLGGCVTEEERMNVGNTEWVEKQIGIRAPKGAIERLKHFTDCTNMQNVFVKYFDLESMLFCVLGPKKSLGGGVAKL